MTTRDVGLAPIGLVGSPRSDGSSGLLTESVTPDWRSAFKSYDELETRSFEFLIEDFLPPGLTFFGGLPGTGKTWAALSVAKALVTGNRFLRTFAVPRRIPVIYLTPETGERAFRRRLDAMRLNDSPIFLCRTNSSGPTLALNSRELVTAVRELKPMVILDTAIRFSSADSENDAAQNKLLANQIFDLMGAGSPGIVAIHHSTKSSAKEGGPTLENTLRGTGDFGAMADAVYSFRSVDPKNLLVNVECVKARDFAQRPALQIQGRPYIDEIGDFLVVEKSSDEEKLSRALTKNSQATVRDLEAATGIGKNRVASIAAKLGWSKNGKIWTQDKNVVQ